MWRRKEESKGLKKRERGQEGDEKKEAQWGKGRRDQANDLASFRDGARGRRGPNPRLRPDSRRIYVFKIYVYHVSKMI